MEVFTAALLAIVCCLIGFVGYMLISGRPIRIEHIHREIIEQPKVDPEDVKAFEDQQQSINDFISTLNREMGVLSDEQIEQSEKK